MLTEIYAALRDYTRTVPKAVQIRSQGTITRVAGRRQSFWRFEFEDEGRAAYVICAPPVIMHRVRDGDLVPSPTSTSSAMVQPPLRQLPLPTHLDR
jgi:hypothetical protein